MLGPLLDRIEVINVPAYLPIEKLNIANQYLIPDLTKEYGFKTNTTEEVEVVSAETVAQKNEEIMSNEKIVLTDAAIMDMINHYCSHEAGVRNLKKALDRVYRKITAKLENLPENEQTVSEGPIEYQINTKNLETFLDIPPTDDSYYININKQLPVGSSNGLAYVNDGYGVVLKIQFVKRGKTEAEKEESKEAPKGSLTTTGRLGEVFSESVEVVKIAVFNLLHEQGRHKDFDREAYHLHVPMGATPKDGPSAGTSLFTALVSSATG